MTGAKLQINTRLRFRGDSPETASFFARVTSFFDVIITGEEVEHGKPAPDIYLRAAEKLDVPAEACLVIEDSLSGVAAAKAAKMRVVAIPDTSFVDADDYEKQADYILSSLKEIPFLIREVSSS